MPPTRLIISEGDGDFAFFTELIKVNGLSGLKVHKRGGNQSGDGAFEIILRSIKSNPDFDDYKLIVIVADNDNDPIRQFRKVKKQIKAAEGYAVPTEPRQIAIKDKCKSTSVLMLPWDKEIGALETVCFSLASMRRPKIASCVQQFIQCTNATKWKQSQLSKLQLRCLMAAASEKDPNVGLQYAWSPSRKRTKNLIPLRRKAKVIKRIVEYLASLPTI